MDADLGVMYGAARRRITDLVREVPESTPVPGTPEWSVHDVIAHLRGIVEDALTGNLDGVATDPWTAAQVERARDKSLHQLLDEWTADAPLFEGFLSSPAGVNSGRAVLDVHTHEADLRGALGLSAAVPADYGAFMVEMMAGSIVEQVAEAGLPAVRIETKEGDAVGPADAACVLRIARHELHRAAFGRRSPEQVAAYDWSITDPSPYVVHVAVFGPRPDALID